jgi:hypothetical protein
VLYRLLMRSDKTDEPRLWGIWPALLVVIAVGLCLLAGSGLLLWLSLGRPALSSPQPLTAADKLDLVRLALLLTGGLGGLIALVVAYRRQRVAEDSNWREVLASRQQNYKLFNDLYISTSEMLGHSSAAVRHAGIYAMARLADDWPVHRQACIDVLCAYLRTPPEIVDGQPNITESEAEVRRSAGRLVAEHLRDGGTVSWAGYRVDVPPTSVDGGKSTAAEAATG